MPIWVVLVQAPTMPPVETVWPTSIAGWLAVALSLLAIIGYGVTAWKASNRPVLTKIEEAKASFTRELSRVERDMTAKVTDTRRHIDDTLDDYHKTVTAEINGWAKRFEDDHSDIARHESAIGDIAGKLIETRTDRDHMNRRVGEMAQQMAEMSREMRDLERRVGTAITASEQRIIQAIHDRVKIITERGK